jgi:GntR family transcriptional regulator / MocR family aminotransferase
VLGGIQHVIVDYSDPAGHWPLRSALANHLRTARGIKVDPEQIVIVSGCQQGLGLAGRLLDITDRTVVLEDPCYRGAAYAFKYMGAKLQHVRVSDGDYNADQLPKEVARLAVVTPSHQFPLGFTMSAGQRERLLAWAENTGSYILEDDYDSDFQYDSSPLLALFGMDRAERVIYVGTFSKSVGQRNAMTAIGRG